MKKTLAILLLAPLLGACATATPEKAATAAEKPATISSVARPKLKPSNNKTSPAAKPKSHMNMAEALVVTGADAAWHLFPLFMNAVIP